MKKISSWCKVQGQSVEDVLRDPEPQKPNRESRWGGGEVIVTFIDGDDMAGEVFESREAAEKAVGFVRQVMTYYDVAYKIAIADVEE